LPPNRFERSGEGPGERGGVNLLWVRTEVDKVLAGKLGAQRLERAALMVAAVKDLVKVLKV
jgi:hypothetical protein